MSDKKKKAKKFFSTLALLILLSAFGLLETASVTKTELYQLPYIFAGIFVGVCFRYVIKPLVLEYLHKKKPDNDKET